MSDRERMIKLLENDDCPLLYVLGENVGALADYLIANGATVLRWIPVTEKMPKDFVSVLIVAPGEHPLPLVHEAYHANNCWASRCVIYNDDEITHWMPLPEAHH